MKAAALEARDPTDQAREDQARWIKAYHARRPVDALEIASRYGLDGMPAEVVTAALHAASLGRDPLAAIEDHMEGTE